MEVCDLNVAGIKLELDFQKKHSFTLSDHQERKVVYLDFVAESFLLFRALPFGNY